jgi:hypothetical protein
VAAAAFFDLDRTLLEFNSRVYPHARRRIPPAFVAAGAAGIAALVATRSRGR